MTNPVTVTKFEAKSHNTTDETRSPDKTRVEVVRLQDFTLGRINCEPPRWHWSQCLKPAVLTDICRVSLVGYAVSGSITVRMNDGTEKTVVAGDSYSIPPGPDAGLWGLNALFVLK